MSFSFAYDRNLITITISEEKHSIFSRVLKRQKHIGFDQLSTDDRAIAFALADLKALTSSETDDLTISDQAVHLSHDLASQVDTRTAEVLGFPPLVDLVLETDVEGILGSPSFRITYSWHRHGRKEPAKRVGAILETGRGPRRLTKWVMDALDVADAFETGDQEATHWEALARFRQALDPGVKASSDQTAARVSMTDFLQGLRVRLSDGFSLSPKENDGLLDFDLVPFSGHNLQELDLDNREVTETDGELDGSDLAAFQKRFRVQGALPAYRLGDRGYLVVENSAAPVLEVMAAKQRAHPTERDAFVKNPRPAITEAVELALKRSGRLESLTDAGTEEVIEAATQPLLIETKEYSERVIGLVTYLAPSIDMGGPNHTTWLPESFSDRILQTLDQMDSNALSNLLERIDQAVTSGETNVDIGGHSVPANNETRQTIEVRRDVARRREAQDADDARPDDTLDTPQNQDHPAEGPIVLDSVTNFLDLEWQPERGPRQTSLAATIPAQIKTALKNHQQESLAWQQAAWSDGIPGILNADEQGLGKTLQTIAFLRWLKDHMTQPDTGVNGPVLVVAPTSLLEAWEAEVQIHLDEDGLGYLIRLYGGGIGTYRASGAAGVETATGETHLDFRQLHDAIEDGKGHRFWILTTYQTLINYQHSLARIPFSAVVFDEIQALKNPVSLRAVAARAMNADFRIGLTGTPIENSLIDLWAIMDQLCPGSLGSLAEFRERYGTPDESCMTDLHGRVFNRATGRSALAIRRLKADVATDLYPKNRRLHPRVMPDEQAVAYEGARSKFATGVRGAALKMLHHIRSVSVHPYLDDQGSNDEFISLSGRLTATFDILKRIQARNERALVFIEHRRMQERFVALARQEFGLNQIDLINGDTPIPKRMAIVQRFQRHLKDDGGFDLLVLGPKAAGTGLTLTAATHVIHLSRWWNPAVEEQCNDRVHRIGQMKPVTVHIPMAIHSGYLEDSFDCLLHSLMSRKRRMASAALWPMGDTSEDTSQLQDALSGASAKREKIGNPVTKAIEAMYRRDGSAPSKFNEDGSISFQ